MPCPFFYPLLPAVASEWDVPPRLPLGRAYEGECRAAAPASSPDASQLYGSCYEGYARGRCERFPSDAKVDAVRFHVAQREGSLVRIQFVLEAGCWPVEHGVLEHRAGIGFAPPPANEILAAQASAFLASYLVRAGEAL
jgi:hypothetical protein